MFGIENGEEFLSEVKKILTSESKKYYSKAAKRIDKAVYNSLWISSPDNHSIVWRLWDNHGQRDLVVHPLNGDSNIISTLAIKMEYDTLCYENINSIMEKYGVYPELRVQVHSFLVNDGFFESISDKKVRGAVAHLRIRTREKLKEKEIQEEIRKHDTERAEILLKNEIPAIIRHMDRAGMSEEDLIRMIREFRIEEIQNG
jgi:hypothetical protein